MNEQSEVRLAWNSLLNRLFDIYLRISSIPVIVMVAGAGFHWPNLVSTLGRTLVGQVQPVSQKNNVVSSIGLKQSAEPSCWYLFVYWISSVTFMVAGAGFEPATFGLWARRAASCSIPRCLFGAEDRNRTDTTFKGRRILSPVRLPVPPPRLIWRLW